MRFVIGILVFLAATCLAVVVLGGNIMDFLNLPIAFMFLSAIVAVLVMKGGFKTLIVAINALLSKKYSISAADQEKAIRLFKLLAKTVRYASVLFTMICLINILMNVDYPNPGYMYVLGVNIAATFVFIIYALIINMVFIHPAIDILETRHNAELRTMISEKQVIDKLLELSYKQGVTPEEIMEAGEISFKKKQ